MEELNNAAEANIKKDRVKWFFDPEARLVGCSIGSVHKSYDLSRIIDMDAIVEVKALCYYGFKQWLASNWAGVGPSAADKWTSAESDYEGLIASGLELKTGETGETRMSIKGRSSGNKGEYIKISKKELNTQVWSYAELKMMSENSILSRQMSPEMRAKLADLELKYEEQEKINSIQSKLNKVKK